MVDFVPFALVSIVASSYDIDKVTILHEAPPLVVEQEDQRNPPYYQEGHEMEMPAVITGPSTKNCRVERMLRDLLQQLYQDLL